MPQDSILKVTYQKYQEAILLNWDNHDTESSQRMGAELRVAKIEGPLQWVVAQMAGHEFDDNKKEERIPRTGHVFLGREVKLDGFSHKLDHRVGEVPAMGMRQKIAIDRSKRSKDVSWDT